MPISSSLFLIKKGRKFGKAELTADNRQLRFYGNLQLRTSKGFRDTLCLLMTDILVLLSESSGDNNRYSLFSTSGNRQVVLNLRNIVVQTPVEGAKSKLIYVICPSDDDSSADLYEFKCPNSDNWKEWLRQLKEATVDVLNSNNGTNKSDVKVISGELSTIQQKIDELCAAKNTLLRDSFALTRLKDVRRSTRLALEVGETGVVGADQELRTLIEDMQRSVDGQDSMANSRMSGSLQSGSSEVNDDWKALVSTWLVSAHGILATVSNLQQVVADQKQQLSDVRLHPSYLARVEELKDEELRVAKMRENLQRDREELNKKKADIDNSFMYLCDKRKQQVIEFERESAEIRREKEELRVAKEKLAHEKEILQRQTDLNLQERAKVEEQKTKLRLQQLQQLQEQQQHAHCMPFY